MKTKRVLSFEEQVVLSQSITRRILTLEHRMLEYWKTNDTHKLQHDARQVAVLHGLLDKIGYAARTGKWPEE